MASIVKRNKSYCVVYYAVKGGGVRKQVWETYKSEEEALKRKRQIEHPTPFLGTVPRITNMEELLEEYIKLYGKGRWSLSTYSQNCSVIRNIIIPQIGKARLSSVNQHFMSRYFYRQRKQMENQGADASATERKIFELWKLFRSVFRQSVLWGFFEESPLNGITIKKPAGEKRDFLTLDQVITALNEALETNMRLAVAIQLAFICSLRKGELLGLRWQDVDLEGGMISVKAELSRVQTEALEALNLKDVYQVFPAQLAGCTTRLVLKKPKTESSLRMLYLPEPLIACLRLWKEQQAKDRKKYRKEYEEHDLVFAQENGMPPQEKQLTREFSGLLEKCGLPDVIFHSLRHTSTTYKLIVSRGNIKAVQGDNGHSQADMVLNVYAQIIDTERKKIAEKIGEEFYSRVPRLMEGVRENSFHSR